MELLKRPAGNVLLAGTGLGLLILGVGGRLAMAAIQVHAGARVRARQPWLEHALFAALLLLVTMRGLRGTAEIGRWYFYPLVALYGAALTLLTRQRQRPSGD